jgi:hypothetical protein
LSPARHMAIRLGLDLQRSEPRLQKGQPNSSSHGTPRLDEPQTWVFFETFVAGTDANAAATS